MLHPDRGKQGFGKRLPPTAVRRRSNTCGRSRLNGGIGLVPGLLCRGLAAVVARNGGHVGAASRAQARQRLVFAIDDGACVGGPSFPLAVSGMKTMKPWGTGAPLESHLPGKVVIGLAL